jgi:ribosomal protein S18 acetylase RimI-like enzyme
VIRLAECKQIRLASETEIQPFDCGDPDLNEFLFQDSKNYLAELLTVTYLYEYGNDTVAFFTVSNDKIFYDESIVSKPFWNRFSRIIPNQKRMKGYPAVKIGRFGVDIKYRRNKLGTQLLDFIKMFFLDNNKTGCRYITVDAYNNPATLGFYDKNDFSFLTESDVRFKTRLMYFDLKRISG